MKKKEMVEINNITEKYRSIDNDFLKKTAEKVLKGETLEKDAELSIGLVDSENIRVLNNKYRKKDCSTDVLSFGKIGEEMPEIIICPEEAKKNAEERGEAFEKELARVLIHGILHTLGYDHEEKESEAEKMFAKQEEYLSKIKF